VAGSRQQVAGTRDQIAKHRLQIVENRQQATDCMQGTYRLQAADSRKQEDNNR